jgi:hypothetical protein
MVQQSQAGTEATAVSDNDRWDYRKGFEAKAKIEAPAVAGESGGSRNPPPRRHPRKDMCTFHDFAASFPRRRTFFSNGTCFRSFQTTELNRRTEARARF